MKKILLVLALLGQLFADDNQTVNNLYRDKVSLSGTYSGLSLELGVLARNFINNEIFVLSKYNLAGTRNSSTSYQDDVGVGFGLAVGYHVDIIDAVSVGIYAGPSATTGIEYVDGNVSNQIQYTMPGFEYGLLVDGKFLDNRLNYSLYLSMNSATSGLYYGRLEVEYCLYKGLALGLYSSSQTFKEYSDTTSPSYSLSVPYGIQISYLY